jgi:hypothetical protein
VERQKHEKQFGALRVRIENPAPRKGFLILAGASKVLGQYLIDVLLDGGIKREREVDGVIQTVLVPITEILSDPREMTRLTGSVIAAIGRMDPDDSLALAESLILGQASVAVDKGPEGKGWAWVEIPEGEEGRQRIDNIFPSYFALIGVVRWAFVSYFLPTFAAPDTDESTETGSGTPGTTEAP